MECLGALSGSLAVTSQVASQHAGNDDAFRRYVLPELDVLLRVARRLTGHPAQAQDLAQETLIRAYRAIERFDGSARGWSHGQRRAGRGCRLAGRHAVRAGTAVAGRPLTWSS